MAIFSANEFRTFFNHELFSGGYCRVTLPAVLKHLSGMEGLYKQARGQLNRFKYWIQTDEKHAIWFSRDRKSWMIGENELRGTKDAKIRSTSNVLYSRPYGGDDYQWQYHKSGKLMGFWGSAGWFDAPDIQVVEYPTTASQRLTMPGRTLGISDFWFIE